MGKQNKRLLVVSNMYPSKKYPHYGVFVKHSAEILQKAGYKVDVVSMNKTDGKLKKLFVYFCFYSSVLIKGIFGRYNAIYAHYASHTALPLLILKKLKNIPIIMNVHGNDIVPETEGDYKFLGLVRKILSKSQLIICPSEYFKNILLEDFNEPSEKIFVYPSGGVNTELFTPISKELAAEGLGLNKTLSYWAYVSRIEEKKGWDLFLNAAARLINNYPSVRLIVVGDGDQADEFNSLADKLGIKDKIIKFSLLPQSEISKVFSLSDLFIFPTYRKSESLGLVGLEAMACEAVTIVPNRYGPASYSKDKENAFVFESGNLESLIETIKTALESDCEVIKKNARKTAQEYSNQNSDTILEDIFEGFLNR